MPTVSEEMSNGERRRRLLHGLKATGDDEVALNFSHLAQAVGMDKAESLVLMLCGHSELTTSKYNAKPQIKKSGICTVNRESVIEAINKITIDEAKKFHDRKIKDQADKATIHKAIKNE